MSPCDEDAPFVQHDDASGNRADEVHVVLDHDDGVLTGERDQQLGGPLGFMGRHAGHRLVHEQQLGFLHEQHTDLEPLLLAMGEDLSPAYLAGRSGRSLSSTLSMRSRCAGVNRATSAFQKDLSPFNASSRFSNTLRNSNTLGF